MALMPPAVSMISLRLAYLRWLLAYFEGDVVLVAAAYNAGEGAVRKYKGVPPYDETQVYVERVAVLRQRYRNDLALATATPSM